MAEQNQKNPLFKKRLFAGIAVPEEVTAPIIECVSKMKKTASQREMDVKWLPPAGWHVTVWFFGETSLEKIDEISKTLSEAAAQVSPFELELKGFGAFPDPQSARVIWAGVNRTRELLSLHDRVQASLHNIWLHNIGPHNISAGFKSDEESHREYVPHVSVGRLRSSASVTALLEPVIRRKLTTFEVAELVLYESEMQGFLPKYTPLQRFSFLQRR